MIRRALAAAAGFMIGALPVIWVHLAVWMDSGEIFALQGREAAFGPVAAAWGWGSYYRTLATLAVPDAIQRIPLPRLVPLAEGVCFTAALAVCALIAAYRRAASLAGLLVGWLAIAASFLTLPAQARPNHLLAATPLIYAAVAVALEKTRAAPTDATWIRPLRRSLFATVALWLVVRCFAMATAEGAYWGGATTRTGNPNFTRFARHAATRDERATFLVGQWGIGNSLYCESQGKPGRVIEASIWSSEDLAAWMRGRDGPLFLVGFEPGWFTETHPQTDRILATLRAQADWIESRALEGLNGFRPLVVWRFDRR